MSVVEAKVPMDFLPHHCYLYNRYHHRIRIHMKYIDSSDIETVLRDIQCDLKKDVKAVGVFHSSILSKSVKIDPLNFPLRKQTDTKKHKVFGNKRYLLQFSSSVPSPQSSS